MHDSELIIVLIGMPGSGKSTVGRQLAKRLELPFVDSDQLIEQRIGSSIREYFQQHGEKSFRELEESVLRELTESGSRVLATGGGAVLRPGNRERLRASGKVFYLQSSPDELFRRLRHDTARPLLQVEDPLARLRSMYEERDPLYRQTAHFVIEIGRPSLPNVLNTIVMQLELAGLLPPRP